MFTALFFRQGLRSRAPRSRAGRVGPTRGEATSHASSPGAVAAQPGAGLRSLV